MKQIICSNVNHDKHYFYLEENGERRFLFSQNYKKVCEEYFGNGINLNDALDKSKGAGNVLKETKVKILKALNKLGREEGIIVLRMHEGYISNTGINKKLYLNYLKESELIA